MIHEFVLKGLYSLLLTDCFMKKTLLLLMVLAGMSPVFAQQRNARQGAEAPPPTPPVERMPAGIRVLNIDSAVTTHSQVTIKGQVVPYDATAGTMPVWDEEGKPIAGVFFTYYERTDVKDRASRPLVISFNGGPGTPSVWMEIGYTGPRRLNTDDEGFPVQPYGVKENGNSILDIADIVYLDPVNTGFSRAVSSAIPGSRFFWRE